MHPTIIGIDPGITGAVCVLRPDGPSVFPMPTYTLPNGKKEVDVVGLSTLLPKEWPRLTVIEEVQGDPKFGGYAAFNFGKSFGLVLGLIQYMYPTDRLDRVRPQKWKPVVLGENRTKEDAIAYVQSVYPKLNLVLPRCRTPSHDLAESVCLARYGLIHLKLSISL